MKIFSLLVFFTLFSFKNFSQSARINSLIKKLDNNQFKIIHGDKPTFKMDGKPAYKLIKIGKPASEKLIAALNDSAKVIMAHLVLCHIYFNVATFAGPKTITVNDKHVSRYFLGQEKAEGLIINEINNNGIYKSYIKPDDLKSIIIYWKNIVK